ncbi:MAG: Uma2 family endonuclease [Deltaproteobacteria bacterium]|nr:MAG: Uma2 family endonuclease [Deltaproteobacteria bacterium]
MDPVKKRRATYQDVIDSPEHMVADIVVPDLAGWRRERLSLSPDASFIAVPPDWTCEVLSRSTEKYDREEKMPLYAASGVAYAWLVHPRRRTIETFQLREGQQGQLVATATHRDVERARIEPFDAIEFDVAVLWADAALPTRASEEPAHYAVGG